MHKTHPGVNCCPAALRWSHSLISLLADSCRGFGGSKRITFAVSMYTARSDVCTQRRTADRYISSSTPSNEAAPSLTGLVASILWNM